MAVDLAKEFTYIHATAKRFFKKHSRPVNEHQEYMVFIQAYRMGLNEGLTVAKDSLGIYEDTLEDLMEDVE